MAKDREGSVNIYGAMQAKTAQGIVAYTDGIAHENEDGTVINLYELLEDGAGGSAIVDVNELIKGGWNGTTVPNSGYVEKIYFNTELTNTEVTELLRNVVSPENTNYTLIYNTGSVEFIILNGKQFNLSESLYAIINFGNMSVIFASEDFSFSGIIGIAGWNTNNFNNPFEINSEVSNDYYGHNVGYSNDIISSLVSTTPFFYAEEPKDDVFYRVKDTSNVVPSSGYIQKIYRNPNITVEEVNSILASLEYTEVDGMDSVLISASQDMSNFFVVGIYDGSYMLSLNNNTLFFNGQWLVEDLSFDIGYESYASEFANQMGAIIQNDKLSNILSVTNKFGIEEKIYSYKNGEYKQILQQGDFEQQEGIEYVEITADSIDNITITQDVYDSINSKDNVAVRLIVDDGSNIKSILLLYKSNALIAEATNTGSIVLFSFSSMEGLELPINAITFLIINNDLTHIYKSIDVANPFTIESFKIQNNQLLISGTKSTGSEFNYGVNIDTTPTNNSKNLISSGAVYTALQEYSKTSEINQMIADYITTNFENFNEGEF